MDPADDTVAAIPLNFTVFDEARVLKFEPVIVTVVPTAPLLGVKLAKAGAGVEIFVVVVAVLADISLLLHAQSSVTKIKAIMTIFLVIKYFKNE